MQKPFDNILNYRVSRLQSDQCIDLICDWLASGDKGKVYICANPHSLVKTKNDAKFQQAFHDADLVTPDGIGIVIASKILGGKIRKRVTGSDIFWGLNVRLNETGGISYFFLGSTEETLAAIKEKMAVEYPNISFAGSYSPPYKPEFSEEDSQKMIEAVNAAGPDVLWVGMTAPKQEKWISRHRDQLDVKFMGAVFDFYSGTVKRPHPIFQKMGLEWLVRFLKDPRRLFWRYFVSTPLFLWRVFCQRLAR